MRIRLTIDHLPKQKLPINYPYLISSWVYNTLHESDARFANWLHEQGYTLKGKKYKHFCFSMLKPKLYKIHKREQVFELVEGPTELSLSFNMDKGAKNMIKGLFQNNLIELKSGQYFNFLGMITQVAIEESPMFSEQMQYRAQTPICISVGSEDSKHAQYLHPTDERFADAFASNLVDKANAYLEEEKYKTKDVQFKLKTKDPKSKLYSIKGIDVRGFLFDFELTAPQELQEIGYYAGFGTQGSSLGYGFCEEKVTK